MIITGPGVEGTRQVDSFAYVTDIMPTILELAELEHPAEYQGREVEPVRGRSLAGVLLGSREYTYPMNALIGAEMMGGKWMRQGAYKAVLVAKPFGPGEWRLYDTAKDPGETTDLSAEHPEILEELVIAWGRYAKDVGVVSSE